MSTTEQSRTKSGTVRAFRVVAAVEALSWLILIVATIVKYATTPHKQLGVQIMGPIHGLLFLAYVVMAIYLRPDEGWSTKTTLLILLGAVLPFGGYVVDWTILRSSDRSPAMP